jgi:hypothetical protein
MRLLLTLSLCGAIAAPGGLAAQEVPVARPDAAPPATLAPFPGAQPTEDLPAAQTALPPPSPETGIAKPNLAPPTTVAPVIVEAQDKGQGGAAGKTFGTIAAGVAGGAAGAVVAGPVGKIAGGLFGKRIARGLFGRQKYAPQVQVAERIPAADDAARPAAATADAPPRTEPISDSKTP